MGGCRATTSYVDDIGESITMMQIKRYLFAMMLFSLAYTAQAAELGSVVFRSFLGAPLDIKMELRLARAESLSKMQCAIANPDEFTALGYSKSAFSADIQCRTVAVGKGKSAQLWLSTQQPVDESLFNLVLAIKADPSAESQLKEFTVVLDPQVASLLPRTSKPNPAVQSADQYDSLPKADSERTLEIKPDQTLLGVAKGLGVSQLEINQFMLAVLQNNPNAFIDGNINRLKKGSVLSLPSEPAWQAIDKAEAQREIKMQYQRGKSQQNDESNPDAQTAQEPSSQTTAVDQSSSTANDSRDVVRLSKVAGKSAKVTQQEEINALRDELAAHEMSIREANKKTVELENQIAEMQKLLVLKQSLARQKVKQQNWLNLIVNRLMQHPWLFLGCVLAFIFALLWFVQFSINGRVKQALASATSDSPAPMSTSQANVAADNVDATLHKTEQILKDISLDLEQPGFHSNTSAKATNVAMQFDLVSSYLDLGDTLGASKVLQDIIQHGDDEQQARARAMLSQIR
jgi:FimV-like protein